LLEKYNDPNLLNHEKYLKIKAGDEIQVKAKDARKDDFEEHIWFGELNGKNGYFQKKVVREILVFTDKLIYRVPSEV
jgi:hypothetical protein